MEHSETKNLKKPTARPGSPALRWAFACLLAVGAGVVLSYCWRVFYYLDARVSPLAVTLGCAAFGLALVGAAALVRLVPKTFAGKSALCIALCGLLFVFANPPMQAPDESQYYLRCDAISRGYLDFDAARTYPDDVAALYEAFPGAWVNAHTSQGMMADSSDPENQVAYTTAGYALKQYGEDGAVQSIADSFAQYFASRDSAPETPLTEPVSFLILPFLPQALGMALARLLGFGALGCFYAGRIANLAAYTALCWLALRSARRFRPALLAVMLLPLSLFMAGSLSYDATLLGCYYLMAALLTRAEWDTPAAAVYAAACVFVNVAKPYINLLWVFLPLALAAAACKKRKGGRWLWLAGMLAGALAATLLVEWYGSAFRFNYPVIERMGGEDVSQMAQLLFILRNPLRFVAVLAGTLYENDFFVGQLGLFGWKDLPVPLLSLTGPAALCAGAALAACGESGEPEAQPAPRWRWGLAAFCLLYGVGAMTAMYITYTPVSMVRIVGLQARYFLPVWLLCCLLLADFLRRTLRPALAAARAETLALRLFAPYAAVGALLLFQHYWIGPVFTIF